MVLLLGQNNFKGIFCNMLLRIIYIALDTSNFLFEYIQQLPLMFLNYLNHQIHQPLFIRRISW